MKRFIELEHEELEEAIRAYVQIKFQEFATEDHCRVEPTGQYYYGAPRYIARVPVS